MIVVDFSDYEPGNINYGGSEKKLSILVPQEDGSFHDYMLKFQKDSAFGFRNNHICEYLGSHIFGLMGFDVQDTFLGTYKGQNVVACRSFVNPPDQFVPFNDVGESTLDQDKERYQYEYDDIMQMLRDNSKLTNTNETIDLFWDMFIADALLGNFDRHGNNWGFIKHDNVYSLAPVFDNGSCLFPNMTDEAEMKRIISSEEETEKRVFTFPTSQIKLDSKKSSYYQVISSLQFEECNQSLKRVVERLDMNKIYAFLDSVDILNPVQHDFYCHMLNARYQLILFDSYQMLTGVSQ